MKPVAAIALAVSLGASGALPASAADYIAAPAVTSICDQHGVLSDIVSSFDHADEHLLQRDLAINDFSAIRLTHYEPRTEKNLIERYYCAASANMSDSRSRPVWYLVETGMGFAGAIGDNVEFCVAGLDPLRVYGADCNVLQRY